MENTENIKKCPACGAENKVSYKFCNICGAVMNQTSEPVAPITGVLYENDAPEVFDKASTGDAVSKQPICPKQHTAPVQPTISFEIAHPAEGSAYNPNKEYIDSEAAVGKAPNFDDVTAAEMFTYNGYRYNLFKIMQKLHFIPGGKKFSWSLLFCGLFFGFFGMSMWYLYHKVYKHACIFLTAGVVIFAVNTVADYIVYEAILDGLSKIFKEASHVIPGLIEGRTEAIFDVFEVFAKLAGTESIISTVLGGVLGLVQLIFAIVMPFSAFKTYKKSAMESIRKARTNQKKALSRVGGFNGAATAIISVVIAIVTFVVPTALFANFAMDAFDFYDRNSEKIQNMFTYTDLDFTLMTNIENQDNINV